MPRSRHAILLAAAVLVAVTLFAQASRYGPGRTWWEPASDDLFPREERYENPDGLLGVVSSTGGFPAGKHPFFEALGSNGRACVTCHQPANAMSVAASALRERWIETAGKDPVFASIDGSNCPDLPAARRASHSLLLDRGLIRIALPWPPKVQPNFHIEVVRDPTGCNTSPVYGLHGASPSISVFRRPRMVANLKYVAQETSLMADGREPSLEAQAITAALVHEQAAAHPTAEQLDRIVAFESSVFAAQIADVRGGLLNEANGPAGLGPLNMASGRSALLEGAPGALTFEVWRKPTGERNLGLQREFRESVVRGNTLFERGCASCHASGSARAMDIGTTNRAPSEALPDLPLFKVTCQGRVVYTQDPGRALITGQCADVGVIVMQQLRGLAARAPYFVNGSAANLRDVVEFYNRKFALKYSEREKRDLVNFLSVL